MMPPYERELREVSPPEYLRTKEEISHLEDMNAKFERWYFETKQRMRQLETSKTIGINRLKDFKNSIIFEIESWALELIKHSIKSVRFDDPLDTLRTKSLIYLFYNLVKGHIKDRKIYLEKVYLIQLREYRSKRCTISLSTRK